MADLDSKLCGEKNVNYASDSDEEDTPGVRNDAIQMDKAINGPKTGPKGVLEDYRQYKELKKIDDEAAAQEKIAMFKKLSFTADPNKHKKKDKEEKEENSYSDDAFLKKYHEKRLAQMKQDLEANVNNGLPKFNKCFELTGDELLDTIENENRKVLIVLHLYDKKLKCCVQMNKCFDYLAKQYSYVKFCKVLASSAGLSLKFKTKALPTIQVYKEHVLIGNFIKMMDKLDEEFYPADVENFLIDSDILTSGTNFRNDLEDSDCELD